MKKQILHLSIGLLACGAVLCGCSKSGDAGSPSGTRSASKAPLEIKVKWTVGKKYVQRMEIAQTSDINMPNNPQPVKQIMNMTEDYTISVPKELPDGGRQLDLEFQAIKMESQVGGRTVLSFDSMQPTAQDAGNPLAPMMRKMVGLKITYLTDADGKVQKVEGFEEMMARITDKSQPEMQLFFKSMFNEDTLKQFFDFQRGLPDHPVKPGDSWPVKLDFNAGPIGKLTMETKNTFKNWEQHGERYCARLAYKGEMSSQAGTGTNEMKIEIENGKMAGDTWFDPELGMIVDSTGDQNMIINITAQGRPMNMQTTQKVTLKLIEVADLAN